MADILEGRSEHMHFAPLSTEQTRAVAKHLQAQMDELNTKLQGFEKEKDLSNGLRANLIQDLQSQQARIDDLKSGLDAARLEVDMTKKDIHQGKLNAQKLRSDLENTNSNLGHLRDDHHKTEQLAKATADSLVATNNHVKQTRDMVENKVQPSLDQLREDLHKTVFDAKQLKDTCDQIRADAKTQIDNLRATHALARGIGDNCAKTDSSVQKLAQKTDDLGKTLVNTQNNLDGTRSGLMKLQDNQVRTASAVNDVQGGLKKLHDDAKLHKEHLNTTAANLGANQGQLDRAVGDLGKAKDALAQQDAMIGKLKSSLEVLTAKNQQMSTQLEQTDMMARGVKKGLDQTNAVVLPNLALDPHVATSHEYARTRSPRASKLPGMDATMKPMDGRSGTLNKSGSLVVAG
mmetsp:Transcript_15390/g.30332  ORF Transcript_15390/g.30332 Transcript_15390/m.30332 type:complete len:404 (+) Transcript_15390:53-1264(+)|eukprot:CAMPEP_0172669530 /NCGR_PEP_ID=MMETSP1074-20121228/9737_1 /TAXON_ID=2916 /ORGANISM="Ceratium fusus, Strain PA161109" /LENGTH=403 /DNA_ID=CAMNT_0013486319 /DNA_START=58 /DNA_END=1269 /DNA_ORIENTATION=+